MTLGEDVCDRRVLGSAVNSIYTVRVMSIAFQLLKAGFRHIKEDSL